MNEYEIWVKKDCEAWPWPWVWKITHNGFFVELGSAMTEKRAIRQAQGYVEWFCRGGKEERTWRKVGEQGCEKNIGN